jgi:hypothetical protein
MKPDSLALLHSHLKMLRINGMNAMRNVSDEPIISINTSCRREFTFLMYIADINTLATT